MASVFHGFRITSADVIPLHVGEYLLTQARKKNKNLLVFADADISYMKRWGLHA